MKQITLFVFLVLLSFKSYSQCGAVTTAAQLEACLETPANVTLAANIDLTGFTITIPNGAAVSIQLAGFNISWNPATSPWVFANPGVTTTMTVAQGANVFGVVKSSPGAGQMTLSGFNSLGSAAAALPIELKQFTATLKGASVMLEFVTTSEQNNDYFEVERSTDGINYAKIGEKDGAGDARIEQNYSFEDTKPQAGINYYRLRQVDTDGRSSVSPVRSVLLITDQEVVFYPNPVAETMNVQLEKGLSSDAPWQIMDMLGRVQSSGTFVAEQLNLAIPVQNLPAGNYVLRLATGQTVVTNTFVKS